MPNLTTPFVLCVDLDGVVGDYHTAFKASVARQLDIDPASMGPQTHWDFFGTDNGWGIRDREHFMALHERAVIDDSLFATMPAIDGASDTLWLLSDNYDVHVRIVTHRLVKPWNHDLVVSDTVRWLQRRREDDRPRIPYRDVCFIADKADVGGDLYIDDAPHNITALRDAGFEAVVFDATYNQDVDGLRAHDWDDVRKIVEERLGV